MRAALRPLLLDKHSRRVQNQNVNAVIRTTARLLAFRASRGELRGMSGGHLIIGLCLTWLVGMGRWWEDPKANWLQHLGIGSVVYVFVLALFLWLVLWPLTPPHWSLRNILIFVTLTSPPAFFYALPVRHGLALATAQTVRLWMLAIVAGWRVALLFFYLRRGAGLSGGRLALAAAFPLLLIVFALTSLNLERVVFDFMGGVEPGDRTVNDRAYGILFLLSMLSALAFLPLLAAYLVLSVNSILAKYGRSWANRFYVLALFLGGLGVGLNLYKQMFLGTVCVGMGLVIAVTTAYKLNARKGA